MTAILDALFCTTMYTLSYSWLLLSSTPRIIIHHYLLRYINCIQLFIIHFFFISTIQHHQILLVFLLDYYILIYSLLLLLSLITFLLFTLFTIACVVCCCSTDTLVSNGAVPRTTATTSISFHGR